ncbi:MAG: type II toxin-antitoxin system RelE/ParE family toxin [Crocosphaera sp.]
MIKSIKHKGLSKFHQTGNTSGIQSKHAKRLRLQLTILESAVRKEDLNRPGFNLHQLKGEYKGRYAISVSGNWRLTFEFRNGDVYILDYEDYH